MAAAGEGNGQGLNAKQRRLLKRAAARGEAAPVATPMAAAAATTQSAPPQQGGAEGLNAKQRRLLKRAQERGEAVPAVPTGPKPTAQRPKQKAPAAAAAPVDAAGLNSRQRRLLNRAAARGEARPTTITPAQASATPAAATAVAPDVDPSTLNAKQRRLLKRAQERGEAPPPSALPAADAVPETPAGGKKRKRGAAGEGPEKVPHVVFVGQLSFKTTADQLRAHLAAGGVTGGIRVRLLTDKKTGKSRGQAFVTLEDAERQFKCLALHHTKLDGRVINVERSCGGKNADKRKEKIRGLREEQRAVLQTTCERIVAEKVEAGLLKEDELDEQAKALLIRYDGATAAAILDQYCAEDRNKLRNPSAFFMMLAKRVVEEGAEAVAATREERDRANGKVAAGSGDGDAGGKEQKRPRRGEKGEGRSAAGAGAGKGGRGDRAAQAAVEHAEAQQQQEPMEEEEDDEDEGRGWGMPHVAALPAQQGDRHHHKPQQQQQQLQQLLLLQQRGGQDKGGDDYDISRVFSSMRGRGGFSRGGGMGRGGFLGGRGGGGRGAGRR